MVVSIHAPARGATGSMSGKWSPAKFQSTRPHGARPGRPAPALRFAPVSIHAPARGATAWCCPQGHACVRFNPRARTGRDVHFDLQSSETDAFQSTRPHGARPPPWPHPWPRPCFNPHARTGRDLRERADGNDLAEFQSTRPHGARQEQEKIDTFLAKFQSTRPHGARPIWNPSQAWLSCFNPRARTGRDARPGSACSPCRLVSIHAPARGATSKGRLLLCWVDVSIHAPARGATSWLRKGWLTVSVSIHAPARGATMLWDVVCKRVKFQSTRPHGARRNAKASGKPYDLFQSTRPHGARPLACKLRGDGSAVSIHAPARGATPTWRPSQHDLSGFNPRARTGRDAKEGGA